ncbi:hypothetical protein TRFO_21367 [Tritrichomonas foetus]|uniref:Ion transport domain-containing protein n=1 Tax=Tritrichomonas foetus TaxID=1144522 RepID=A0A1J4KF46_9EUKA|nr:hypothetical protein TRFO_21367 [Tritrichomonas foetus]|eukprot:OHT09650.1 hypothetical protein TRFO_21367 [Tritrichomonas foetus]
MRNEDFIPEDDKDTDLSDAINLGGAISLRSMLLRHQLAQEIRVMNCENLGSAYHLSASNHTKSEEYTKSLARILQYTPFQPIGNPPIIRNEPGKHIKIARRRNVLRYRYSVPFFYTAFKITKNVFFKYFVTLLLLVNICTSVYLISADEEENALAFTVLRNFEFGFTVIFCVEMCLKIIAKGKSFLNDIPLIVDLVLLIASILPPGFIILICTDLNYDIMELKEKIKVVYILNAIRVFRLVPRTPPLLRTTKALLKPYKTLAYIGFLILLIMYIFAILGMHLFYSYTIYKSDDFEYQYKFESFANSMVTVFQILTFDCWLQMCKEISQVASAIVTYIYFIAWVWLGAFVFANIFVGVLVDQFKQETERMAEQKENERIAKYSIQARKKHAKGTSNVRKFSPQMQLTGQEISQKVSQLYSQFEAFETNTKSIGTDENFKTEVCRLLKHMGQDYETIWTNEELYKYYKTLCQISDNISEMEQLEKIASQAIHSCLETK